MKEKRPVMIRRPPSMEQTTNGDHNVTYDVANPPLLVVSQRPRSNIPAPGSLKLAAKKDERIATNEQSHPNHVAKVALLEEPSTAVGQSSSAVNDDRESKRQSTVAAFVGYGTQQPPQQQNTVSHANEISSPTLDAACTDSLNQTFTQSKFLYRLIEAEYSQSIGKRVCLGGEKFGLLRYFGPLHVAEGLFCGIELEEELGQHDGFIDGRRYFKALPRHGIFAPVEKVKIVDVTPTLKGETGNGNVGSPLDVVMINGTAGNNSSKNVTMNVSGRDVNDGGCRFDQTFIAAGENFLPPTISQDVLLADDADAELLDDIEPHLMSYSMLDDDNAVEGSATSTTNPLLQSFDLSDSLMFLKQSNLSGFDSSMSASQMAAMVMSSEDTNRKPTEVGQLPLDEDMNVENAYFDEQSTPVCDATFLKDMEENFTKKALFSSSTPYVEDTTAGDDKNDVCGRDIYPSEIEEQKLLNANKLARSGGTIKGGEMKPTSTTITLRQMSNKEKTIRSGTVERPVSTISADTGYQGDTEYDTQSGRSASPPEPDELDGSFEKVCDKTITSQQHGAMTTKGGNILLELQTNGIASDRQISVDDDQRAGIGSSHESLVCETVYRDKAGNVVKIVRCEVPASLPMKKLHSSATIENMKEYIDEQLQPKVSAAEKAPLKREATSAKKQSAGVVGPEGSPSKSRRVKLDSSVGLESSSRKSTAVAAAKKEKETEKKPEKEFVRQKLVKEPEPPPKIVRAPSKPSKHAEIMAKLQNSIAQDKTKPKKDVKSRVYVPSAEDSSMLVPSRSQSRASSVLNSAQISPADGCNATIGDGDQKLQHIAEQHAVVNGEASAAKKPTANKTTDNKNVVGKDPVKRDSVHDVNKSALPPSGTNANKRMSSVTRAASLSNSGRFHKGGLSAQTPVTNSNKTSMVTVSKQQQQQQQHVGNRDELLKVAKENLIHNAKGFQAMCVTIKHYDENVIPALYLQLSEFKKELAGAKDSSDSLVREKSELAAEKEALKESFENVRKENEEAVKKVESRMRNDMEKQIFDLTTKHEDEIKKVMDDFRLKEKRLMKGYEKRQNDDALQYQHKVSQLKEQHTKDINELKAAHTKEIDDLKYQFESKKTILQNKLTESQMLCERYKQESRELEATLMKDIEKKMQHVNERFSVYQQEIDSLRVVVEMKNSEIHELRSKCLTLEKDLETLPITKTKVAVLEQKNAELREALESRKLAEKRLSQRHLELQQTCERERERSVRLSMTNEQLQYRLQHLMMSHSAYETPMSRFASDESDADNVIRDKPMSQSLIQIYAGSSPRTSKQVPVTVYTNEGISRAMLFDKSDSECSSQHRKRTSSERKGSLSDDSCSSPSPQTTSRAKSVDKSTPPSSASSISSGQRRISPLRRRNMSGTGLVVGAPGVETVSEINELRDGFSDVPDCAATKSDAEDVCGGVGGDNQIRKVCKSSSAQGQMCWTDSGIFTSSFHSETADGTSSVVDVVDHPSKHPFSDTNTTIVTDGRSTKDVNDESTPQQNK